MIAAASHSPNERSPVIAVHDANPAWPTDSETCPPDTTLSQSLDGALNDGFNRVALHLNECGACRGRLDHLPQPDRWASRFGGKGGKLDRQFLDEPDLSAAMVACVSTPSRSSELTSPLPPIDRIGSYELIRPLGRGGMGTRRYGDGLSGSASDAQSVVRDQVAATSIG